MDRPKALFYHANRLDRCSFAKLLELHGFDVDMPADGDDIASAGGEAELIIYDLGYVVAHPAWFRRACASAAKVVVMADEFSFEHLRAVLRQGARAFLLYRFSTEALIPALRLVLIGEAVLPTELAALLLAEDRGRRRAEAQADPPTLRDIDVKRLGLSGLLDRDIRILSLVANGLTNKRIARELETTEDMVKLYLRQIMSKINARNRTQAAIWASEKGLAEPIRRDL